MAKPFWSIAAAAALGGCVSLPATAPETVGPEPVAVAAPTPATDYMKESAEVAALLAYYQELLDLPAEELKREYQSVSQSFARDRSELSRLRLALLMCVPGVSWRDDAKLLALLDGTASRKAPPDSSPRRQFIVLLQKLIAERQREQKRADELQQKLDAMLTIERNLRGRRTQKK